MLGATQPSATIVGAGPVACLVAIELRRRSFQVEVFEKAGDFRGPERGRGHSFNLTLTRRGLTSLDPDLVRILYANGVPLPQRVIHHSDGSLSYQRYGSAPEYHLLSIPRDLLHRTLLDEAEKAGARFFFGHECVGVDPLRAQGVFNAEDHMRETTADLLIGCDGANSVVRHEMSRRGAKMNLSQEYVSDGFVELKMPPGPGGKHALLHALRDPDVPESSEHGLHLWPRGEFMLLSQPNVDLSYTTGLFLPFRDADAPSWESTRTPSDVDALFSQHFSDIVEFLPELSASVLNASPSSLKILKCFPYHHGRTVLIGDSAHTLVPFYGQGINCSFEDVRTFCDILDGNGVAAGGGADRHESVRRSVASFTEARKAPGDAISDLSLAMRAELKTHSGENSFHARDRLEKQLHLDHPGVFVPLYHQVAFTSVPYDQVLASHQRQRDVLDELCRRFDVDSEPGKIIDAFPGAVRGTDGAGVAMYGPDLDLAPEQTRSLLDSVTSRLLTYQTDLANGKYPVCYPAESADAAATRLREDDVPQFGADLDGLLTEIFDHAAASGMVHPHPGFLAHVPSGGLFQSAVGEFISRALNRFAGAWAATPGLAQLESNVIRWFCTILGYPDGAFGYLTTGGSIANFMAMRCALDAQGADTAARACVYVSSQGHFSVQKAAKLAGVPASMVRTVDTCPDYTMDLERLREQVELDRSHGHRPTCVVATAGTTNTGAVDDLVRLAAYCREEGIWLHVDACFGGFFRLTARGRHLLAGAEEAHSIAVDAHKSLFLPHGSSALLVREKARLRRAFEVPAAHYVPELAGDEETADFCAYGPELTREIRGLSAWLPIKLHGIKGFERCLDEKLDLADGLAASLATIDGLDVVPRSAPHLPTVVFRLRSPNGDRDNERLCELVCSRGNVYVATTRLPREGLVLRVCVLHHQTDKVIIDQLIEDIRWSIRTMRGE